MWTMLTLREYAKKNKIAYTTACLRANQGKIKTVWVDKEYKPKTRLRMVVEDVKSE